MLENNSNIDDENDNLNSSFLAEKVDRAVLSLKKQ